MSLTPCASRCTDQKAAGVADMYTSPAGGNGETMMSFPYQILQAPQALPHQPNPAHAPLQTHPSTNLGYQQQQQMLMGGSNLSGSGGISPSAPSVYGSQGGIAQGPSSGGGAGGVAPGAGGKKRKMNDTGGLSSMVNIKQEPGRLTPCGQCLKSWRKRRRNQNIYIKLSFLFFSLLYYNLAHDSSAEHNLHDRGLKTSHLVILVLLWSVAADHKAEQQMTLIPCQDASIIHRIYTSSHVHPELKTLAILALPEPPFYLGIKRETSPGVELPNAGVRGSLSQLPFFWIYIMRILPRRIPSFWTALCMIK